MVYKNIRYTVQCGSKETNGVFIGILPTMLITSDHTAAEIKLVIASQVPLCFHFCNKGH